MSPHLFVHRYTYRNGDVPTLRDGAAMELIASALRATAADGRLFGSESITIRQYAPPPFESIVPTGLIHVATRSTLD